MTERVVLKAANVKRALAERADPAKAAFYPRFFKAGPGQYAEGDRFVGVVDGTTLSLDPSLPGAPTTLAQGEVIDFATTDAFRVRSQDPEHPFLVGQRMDTCNIPGGTRPGATAPGFMPPALRDKSTYSSSLTFCSRGPAARNTSSRSLYSRPMRLTSNAVICEVLSGTVSVWPW